jgi:hypothetical protein
MSTNQTTAAVTVRVPHDPTIRWVAALVEGRPVALSPVQTEGAATLLLPIPLVDWERLEVRGGSSPADVLDPAAPEIPLAVPLRERIPALLG